MKFWDRLLSSLGWSQFLCDNSISRCTKWTHSLSKRVNGHGKHKVKELTWFVLLSILFLVKLFLWFSICWTCYPVKYFFHSIPFLDKKLWIFIKLSLVVQNFFNVFIFSIIIVNFCLWIFYKRVRSTLL